MNVVEQIAALRKQQGIPVTVVAKSAGIDPSNIYAVEHGRREPTAGTLERIAAGSGARLLAVGIPNLVLASETAHAIRNAIAHGTVQHAYRALIQLNDDLRRATPSEQVLIGYQRPEPVDAGWDAAIAGLVQWRLQQKRAPLPAWLDSYGLGVEGRWEPTGIPFEIDPDDVPDPLRERGIWIEAAELESV